MRCLLLISFLCGVANASPPEEYLATLRRATKGAIAMCAQSDIDELQIVKGPKELTEEDAAYLGKILGSADSYGGGKATHFSIITFDVKILLHDLTMNRYVGVRVGTRAPAVMLEHNFTTKLLVEVDTEVVEKLFRVLEKYFPDCRTVSSDIHRRRYRFRGEPNVTKTPNKSPEPTPTAVTPRATEPKSK